jgi:hypothetical protein
MIYSAFTKNNFKYLFKHSDFKNKAKIDEESILNKVETKIQTKESIFQSLKWDEDRKILYIDPNHENKWLDTLTLRVVYKHFTKIYNIKQSNRQIIIKILKNILENYIPLEDHNIGILKTDISDFFASIDRNTILDKINTSRVLGFEHKKYIKDWFDYLKTKDIKGLPKGINLSSAFAEYFLKDFDKDIKSMPGILYYARYVDDLILIYNKKELISLQDHIKEKLNDIKLNINESKTNDYSLNDFISGTDKLNYLGYKIWVDKKKIHIGIADKKIRKIKTKICKIIYKYEANKANNNKLPTFKEEMGSLVFNFQISPEEADDGEIKSKLYGGLSYNYMLITDAGLDDLKNLDVFFKRKLKIFKKNNKIEKQDLPYLSFLDSYLLNTLSKGNKDEKN